MKYTFWNHKQPKKSKMIMPDMKSYFLKMKAMCASFINVKKIFNESNTCVSTFWL